MTKSSFHVCNKCLYDGDHPFGITFENGLCSGCRYHLEKDQVDWRDREEKLFSLVRQYRSNSGNYDCVVPVTGGQDSFYVMHLVVNVLKLRPIMVNFNRNFNSKVGLANLARLRNLFDVDFQQYTPESFLTKRMVAGTLREFGTLNWFWIAGQTSYPVRIALEKSVPLIIWGAHQGNEQVGMFRHLDEVEMNKKYRRDFDLMGVDELGIQDYDLEIASHELECIRYPEDRDIERAAIKGLYLGNYYRWDPVQQHKFVKRVYGYLGKTSSRTYYKYDNPDCNFYNNFQDILKFLKLGYSKVTDQLVRDIRHGRVSRKRATFLRSYYEAQLPENVTSLASWLGANPISLSLLELANSSQFKSRILNHSWRNSELRDLPNKRLILIRNQVLNAMRTRNSDDVEDSEFGRGWT